MFLHGAGAPAEALPHAESAVATLASSAPRRYGRRPSLPRACPAPRGEARRGGDQASRGLAALERALGAGHPFVARARKIVVATSRTSPDATPP